MVNINFVGLFKSNDFILFTIFCIALFSSKFEFSICLYSIKKLLKLLQKILPPFLKATILFSLLFLYLALFGLKFEFFFQFYKCYISLNFMLIEKCHEDKLFGFLSTTKNRT